MFRQQTCRGTERIIGKNLFSSTFREKEGDTSQEQAAGILLGQDPAKKADPLPNLQTYLNFSHSWSNSLAVHGESALGDSLPALLTCWKAPVLRV